MQSDKQQEAIKKLIGFGWVPDIENYYRHDQQDGIAVICRHTENVAMIYPDGIVDRAGDQPHSKSRIKPRDGWYSPVLRRKAGQRQQASFRYLQELLEKFNASGFHFA